MGAGGNSGPFSYEEAQSFFASNDPPDLAKEDFTKTTRTGE
jgi:hypothetical protein